MNQHNIPVKCQMTLEQLAECKKALNFRRTPPGWRVSEYVCTKASAKSALCEIEKNGETRLFDIGCLSGELARYIKAKSAYDGKAYEAWAMIRSAISGNPDAKKAVTRARKVDAARAKALKLRERADLLLSAASKLDRAAF
jgi:hypothetical protein